MLDTGLLAEITQEGVLQFPHIMHTVRCISIRGYCRSESRRLKKMRKFKKIK